MKPRLTYGGVSVRCPPSPNQDVLTTETRIYNIHNPLKINKLKLESPFGLVDQNQICGEKFRLTGQVTNLVF